MSDANEPRDPDPAGLAPAGPDPAGPGPVWAWTTAWSLQGAMALLAGWLWPEPGWQQFSLMGLGAGLPLAGLYLYLRRREISQNQA